MMQSLDQSNPSHPTSLDYYSQLLSLQQPPPLQALTSSALASYPLTQQPGLQHTMSVADPFSPSWPLFNPPSPSGRKQSGALFPGGAAWLDSAQQLLPGVSAGGLSLTGLHMQSAILPQLSAGGLMQRPSVLQSLPQQPSGVFQPLPQRAGMSGALTHMMSPPPLQQQLSMPHSITPQQLHQLNQLRLSQQQQQAYGAQRMQSLTTMAPPMQPLPTSSQTLQQQQQQSTAALQQFRPTASISAPSLTQALPQQQPASPLQPQPSPGGTVELATVLLSYLSSGDLQRGLLYVNRLWRFKSLYVLQSRQVNVQVQLTHLYLGPFRAANMLELVFSLQVQQRTIGTPRRAASSSGGVTQVQPLRPLQLPQSVPSSPASVMRTPVKSTAPNPSLLQSPTVRATVCTPMALSAVVKAKELSKGDALLNSPSMLHNSGGKQLSKKKLREAALLAESKYNSIIECGILPAAANHSHSASTASQRTFKLYSPFFGKQVEVYTALSDVTQQTLYRASSLAEKFDYATNKVGMYLSRRRLHSGGIYQATGFRSKPAGRTGLKCGGYFLTIEACKEFENHFQYGGLTEEQRKEKTGAEVATPASATSAKKEGAEEDEGEMGDGEESEDEGDEAAEQQRKSADKLRAEDAPHVPHSRPLSAVTKKLVDTGFSHVPSASVGTTNSRKRSAMDDDPQLSPSSGDMSASPSSSAFKRVRSDEGGASTTDSGSGSDGVGLMSSPVAGLRSSSSDEDSNDRSPGRSSRTTHFHSHSQLHSTAASTSFSGASVGSNGSFHRSAFKAPTSMRSISSASPGSSGASVGSSGGGSNNDSNSPPPNRRDLSPSTSPGSQQVLTLPASASFLPSISSSSPPPPSYAQSAFPGLTRWNSFASSIMSPPGNQQMFAPQPTSYVQLSSPPLGVSHKFHGLTLAGAASSQSAAGGSMIAPVVPLSLSPPGQSLDAAFASAIMQGGQAGVQGVAGPSASVGANGLLNLNNLTLLQLQHLLSGQMSASAQPAAQPFGAMQQQQQHPSLLNYVLNAGMQTALQPQPQQRQQPVQFI